MNLDWFKYTGLGAAQTAAHTVLGAIGGDVFDAWHFDYKAAAGLGLGAAIVSILGSIGAYKLPDGKATAVISTGAAAAEANTALRLASAGSTGKVS